MTKTREHKFKNTIFDEKHLTDLQIAEVIVSEMLMKDCRITFSFVFDINENIFMIYQNIDENVCIQLEDDTVHNLIHNDIFLQDTDNVVKDSFSSVIDSHENTSLIYAAHNSLTELFMMFIKKNLKTTVCMIKKKKDFVNVKIKQDSLLNIKEQRDKKHKILDFIEKKNKNKSDNLKKKSKSLFKNISKFFAIHFQN